MKKNKILILSGPGGAGKTTIADILVNKCGFIKLDGEQIDASFFPNGEQWLSKNSDKLAEAHAKILKEAKELFESGNNVVVDYIIFGNYLNFFEKFEKTFGDNLKIKILFPIVDEIIKRDKERECWTTGAERINAVRDEFESIKSKIGEDNFIDTTGETPEITFEKYFRDL